ncbi:hypothetical protein H6H01_34150 [Nostoc calcicola FACHB-3891]|nr:hypothetical protein [Nostoc calcicola FACHB-3891]
MYIVESDRFHNSLQQRAIAIHKPRFKKRLRSQNLKENSDRFMKLIDCCFLIYPLSYQSIF